MVARGMGPMVLGSTAGGVGPPYATPRPHRLSSRGDGVAKVVERAPIFGESAAESLGRYNRLV